MPTCYGDQGAYAAVGVKETAQGEIYLTGLHVPRLIQPESKEAARLLLEPLLDLGKPRKGITPEPFETIWTHWDHKGVSFAYEAKETEPIIVSVTHTPRWHVYLDGKRIPAYRHEDLVLLILPPGKHTVTMHYGASAAVYTGWFVTILAAGWLLWRGRRLDQV